MNLNTPNDVTNAALPSLMRSNTQEMSGSREVNGAATDIVPRAPDVSLLKLAPIVSIIGQLLVNMAFQIAAWKYTMRQPWYQPQLAFDDVSHDTTAVFTVSSFQYIWIAIIFSVGPPYRKIIFTNKLFIVAILGCVVSTLYVVIIPCSYLQVQAELKPSPSIVFRVCLVGLASLNFTIGYLVETYILEPAGRRCIAPEQRQTGTGNRQPSLVIGGGCCSQTSWTVANQDRLENELIALLDQSKPVVERRLDVRRRTDRRSTANGSSDSSDTGHVDSAAVGVSTAPAAAHIA